MTLDSAPADYDPFSGTSSPLSSVLSLSPAPPDYYPSPSSSQELLPTCTKDTVLVEVSAVDVPPPAKKRRIAEPKPRTTAYLDLCSISLAQEVPQDQKAQLDLLLKVLQKKRKIVVIAGAGISVSAGIPDFRSSTGLFSTLRSEHKLKASGKHLFDASVYRSDSSTSSFHDMVRSLSQLINSTRPTAFHHLLATLAQDGRLMRLYSQNVDGIDTSLPPLATKVPLSTKGPWPRTIQLHGGLEKMVCQKCNHLSNFQPALFEGPEPPSCGECAALDSVRTTIAGKRSHGIGKLRPRIVLYNEYNPDAEAIGAVTKADLRSRPDAVIVVGTSLKVPGVRRIVREMCGVVRAKRDGVAIWINNDAEPQGKEFENCWDLVVRGDCEEVARHAGLRRWDDEAATSYEEVDSDELNRVKKETGEVHVIIKTPRKRKEAQSVQGVLTPVGSPHLKTCAVKKQSKGTLLAKSKRRPGIKTGIDVKSENSPKSSHPKAGPKASGLTVAKIKRRKGAATTDNVPKISSAFKVDKAGTTVSTGTKAETQQRKRALGKTSNTGGEDLLNIPFPETFGIPISSLSPTLPIRPHSPQAARTDYGEILHTPEKHNSHESARERPASHADNSSCCSPVDQIHRGFADRKETVSPKGPLPASLVKILNLPTH